MSKVIVGSTDVTRATYKDSDGELIDPDVVVGWVKRPDQTVTQTGVTVTNIATGIYDVTVDADQIGLWYLEITAPTGDENKVLEKTICVVASSVA